MTSRDRLERTWGEPLRRVDSIKLKLGLLVSVSVLVAAVLATLGAEAVPAWLSIPVTVLLALAVTQVLARGMTAPLRRMTDAARRMADGDYDTGVATTSRDEVGELARAFTAMAGQLADVDRQRRELIGTVSHELRTPLTALTALLENLSDGVTRPDAATLAPALRQAERLGGLVEDLLDLSRLDAGVTPLHRRDVELADLLDTAAGEADAVARAAAREVTVAVAVDPPDLAVPADPHRLHQVVANLLDNATRHSPAGGTVHVSARVTGGVVLVDVADEGPGIDPADRAHVLERFGTGATGAGGSGGTGLGLAIARWVAELHGGRLTVADPPSGRGALLRLELPVSPSPTPVPPSTALHQRRPAVTPETPVVERGSRPTGPPAGGTPADDVFGSWWPDRLPTRPAVVVSAVVLGTFAAVAVPDRAPGLGLALVLLAAGGLVWRVSLRRRSPYVVASAVVGAGLALVPLFRDAEWVAVLGVLTAGVLLPTAVADGRSVRGVAVAVLSWPLAGLRGIPWVGRSVRAVAGPGQGVAVARTALLSVAAAVVFGLLFASADAVFGQWFRAIAPDTGDVVVARVFTAVAVTGVVLAAAYLAMNPPPVERDDDREASGHRFEWLVPLLVVDAVFVVFLLAQGAAVVGGGDYVERTTGFTYAAYAREGFGQLTVATALALVALSLAWQRARHDDPGDRTRLRAAAGLLCVLTLLVVVSAMARMWLYTDAYGLTRLRLLVWVFEAWLALVVVALVAAGARFRASWVPRAAVLSAAAILLALAVANPDGVVARVNVDRYEATGRLDTSYLSGLSDDAVPALTRLPATELSCALPEAVKARRAGNLVEGESGWAALNVGRIRADRALEDRDDVPVDCVAPGLPGATS